MATTPAAGTTEFPGVDLDMLANDIADMLDRFEYPIDAADSHIRPALAPFLTAILANAATDADVSTGEDIPGVDLDMLASDIADMLDRFEYPIDVADSDIRPALPAFIAAILANAVADTGWEAEAGQGGPGGDPLSPADATGLLAPVPNVPVPQHGRAPAMTYCQWTASRGVETGATAGDKWYWRCPVCRSWAGPYSYGQAATQTAMDHRYHEHDLPASSRTETRKAARRVCRAMTAARFDETVARLAAAYDLLPATVHSAIHRTADAIHGTYGTYQDALFYTGKSLGTARSGDYGLAPHPRVVTLITAITAELGHPGWLEESMAADARRR
jgi:hypothetical protein